MVETVQNNQYCQTTYPRTLSLQAFTCSFATLEEMKEGNLLGYVQCDLKVRENLRTNFANFAPIFKNTLVSKNDIGDLMKTYAEEDGIMSQPLKMLI